MIDPSSFLRRTAIVLTACMIVIPSVPAYATTVKEAQETKAVAEKNLNSVNQEILNIKYQQELLQNRISEIDSELTDTKSEIEKTESQIKDKQEELAEDSVKLTVAEAKEESHYDSMKERICYMYENGEITVLDSLIGSADFSQMLNKVSNFEAMYNLDRDLLYEYIDAKREAEDLVEIVKEEELELEELQTTLVEQKDKLEAEKENKSSELQGYDTELSNAEDKAQQYNSTISEMDNVISIMQVAETQSQLQEKQQDGSSISCTCEIIEAAESQSAKSQPAEPQSSDESQPIEETNTPTKTNASSTGSAVADYACQFVGNPYVWGGTSLTNGCDCSGFIMSVYANFGVSLPHSSASLRSVGYGVSSSEIQPGDIVCYEGHCAIYIGGGQIVHASNSKPYPDGGIKISSNYAYRTVVAIRRIF